MTASTANNQSVARRVSLMGIALVTLVLVLVAVAMGVLTERSTRAQVVSSVGDTARSLAQSLDGADAANSEVARGTMKGFQRYFDSVVELDASTGEARSYGALINADYGAVDRFATETGGIAAVYAKKGDDFVVITTSVKNAQGERELDVPLPRSSAQYQKASQGEPYVGCTVVGGKPYMGYTVPLKDAAGQVVVLLFIGNDISVFEAMLEKQVAQTRFFQSGGVYVIDPRQSLAEAVFVSHPTARGKKVLEVYPQAQAFLTALADAPDGFVRHAAQIRSTEAQDPWALVRKTEGSGWWVVAEVPDDEAMASQHQITWAVWAMMALAVALLAVGLFVVLRRGVSRPLQELTQAITQAVQVFQLPPSVHLPQRTVAALGIAAEA